MDHLKTPLYERLIQHHSRRTTSFHIPGHKSGNGLDPLAAHMLGAVMSIDLTEIPGLDDLHHPGGVIREAEQLAADCFGADCSFFLVGGSTAGNLALILSLCKRDDVLIVQRNVHKSILHGLMLSGARAVFVTPQIDAATGIAACVRTADVVEALRQYPDAAGVLLSNPNYYGMGMDLRPIVERVHALDKPVLVDEAHGAHFGFHPDFPASALSAGADGVVQSTHKMLTAMTMGAMLHLQGNRLDPLTVRRSLSIVQSSSPSYPILASLDLCRRQMHVHGKRLLGQALQAVERLHHGLEQMPWFQCVRLRPGGNAFETLDPLKITLRDRTGTLGGFELRRELEQDGCIAEMADPRDVLLVFGMTADERDADKLLAALSRISTVFHLEKQELDQSGKNIYNTSSTIFYPPVAFRLHPGEADITEQQARRLAIPVNEAVGCIVDEAVIPYPPGIPILYPGERVSADTANQLQSWIRSGATIYGLTEEGNIITRGIHTQND